MQSHIRNAIRYWYLELILGIIFIAAGIWVFVTPIASYITLTILFSVTFLVTGAIEIAHAVSSRKSLDGWGWSLAGGMLDLLIGLLLVSTPSISMVVLPFYVGFAILFRSIMAVGWSFELSKQQIPGWGALLFIGILGVVFAFILLWNPLFAGLTIVIYTAMAFIAIGLSQIYFSFRLKNLKNL